MLVTGSRRIALVTALVGSSLLVGAGASASSGGPTPKTLGVGTTFTSGASRGTTIKVTDGGNLISYLSPTAGGSTYEHLASTSSPGAEGYVVCYPNSAGFLTNIWDLGASASGWNPPAAPVVAGTMITTSRTDTAGFLLLNQIARFDGPNRAITITMQLTNTSTAPLLGVVVRRQADLNIDAAGSAGWNLGNLDQYAVTNDSAVVLNDPSAAPPARQADGIVMRSLSTTPNLNARKAGITKIPADTTCAPSLMPTPGGGLDVGATLMYRFTSIGVGATVTMVMRYDRI